MAPITRSTSKLNNATACSSTRACNFCKLIAKSGKRPTGSASATTGSNSAKKVTVKKVTTGSASTTTDSAFRQPINMLVKAVMTSHPLFGGAVTHPIVPFSVEWVLTHPQIVEYYNSYINTHTIIRKTARTNLIMGKAHVLLEMNTILKDITMHVENVYPDPDNSAKCQPQRWSSWSSWSDRRNQACHLTAVLNWNILDEIYRLFTPDFYRETRSIQFAKVLTDKANELQRDIELVLRGRIMPKYVDTLGNIPPPEDCARVFNLARVVAFTFLSFKG